MSTSHPPGPRKESGGTGYQQEGGRGIPFLSAGTGKNKKKRETMKNKNSPRANNSGSGLQSRIPMGRGALLGNAQKETSGNKTQDCERNRTAPKNSPSKHHPNKNKSHHKTTNKGFTDFGSDVSLRPLQRATSEVTFHQDEKEYSVRIMAAIGRRKPAYMTNHINF